MANVKYRLREYNPSQQTAEPEENQGGNGGNQGGGGEENVMG